MSEIIVIDEDESRPASPAPDERAAIIDVDSIQESGQLAPRHRRRRHEDARSHVDARPAADRGTSHKTATYGPENKISHSAAVENVRQAVQLMNHIEQNFEECVPVVMELKVKIITAFDEFARSVNRRPPVLLPADGPADGEARRKPACPLHGRRGCPRCVRRLAPVALVPPSRREQPPPARAARSSPYPSPADLHPPPADLARSARDAFHPPPAALAGSARGAPYPSPLGLARMPRDASLPALAAFADLGVPYPAAFALGPIAARRYDYY